MYQRNSYEADLGVGIAGIMLFLALVALFVITVAICYVVRCFVKYGKTHKSLWIALAVCIGSCIAAGVIDYFTHFDGAFMLPGIGIAVVLITCFVVDLKHRDLLQLEKTSLVDQVLHSPWWGSEDKPVEFEREQIAA
jgi:glycerol-3-phosphate acyltransferase PlsY